ncbi:MAG TPA: ABC transporter permease [Burkholderiaceae bacterium]
MNSLAIAYAARNLRARKITTLLTVVGMVLVAGIFAVVLMLTEGLRQTLAGTGSYNNVVITRQGTLTETQSTIERAQANLIETFPGLAADGDGRGIVSREVVVLVNLLKKGTNTPANVLIRGTTPNGLAMRSQAHIVSGRMFRPGTSEIIVGNGIFRNHQGTTIGSKLSFGLREWTVVGVFDAGTSGFNSEVWGNTEQMMQAFRREAFSSVIGRLRDSGAMDELVAAIRADQRLKLELKRESIFYADQAEKLSNFIDIFGKTITAVFSIAAIIGAMITMYSSVANRTREIGTLRALGFGQRAIVGVFLCEAVLLGVVAGCLGLSLASGAQWVEVSTTNFQTFSEISFRLSLTPAIGFQVLAFSVFMGVLGGVLPAVRAARLEIVDALRAV